MSTYELITIIISLIALLVSGATYIWTVLYRGKLEFSIRRDTDNSDFFVCTIVNSGQKPITPLYINIQTENGVFRKFYCKEGNATLGKLLQPGEVAIFTITQNIHFVTAIKCAKNFYLVDAYGKAVPLSKEEMVQLRQDIQSN